MVATPSKLVAFAAVTTYCLLATVTATPLDKNPVTLTGESAPLTASHPAFGGPMRGNIIEAVVLDDDVAAAANSMTITNSSAVEVRTAGEGARRSLEGAAADMQKLQAHFGRALELNYKTLVDKYRSASSSPIPWPASYWPVYQDSINARWTNEPSPAEKYATAFKKNVKQFMDNVSYLNGIDQVKNPNFNGNKVKCTSDSNCASLRDGSKCAIREGAKSGYCIPTWWGICHAWAPASNWEPEPKCDVVKNGVTFHAADLKGLLTAVWDGAEIQTVFTGSRFNGPDEPKELDKYGRFTDAFRRDLGAGFFHLAISNIMGINKHSFIVDVAAGAEVWNHPVRSYQVVKSELMDVKKASQEYFGTSSYPFNNKAKYLAYTKTRLSWIVEGYEDGALIPDRADEYTRSADYEYFVELDGSYNIIGGEWLGASRYEHPDFLWFAKGTPNPNTVTALGLSYKEVRALVEESVACKNTPTPAPTTVKPTTKPTETPETPKPTDSNTSKPPATSEPSTPEPSTGKPGKPTETPVTPEPSTGKPGKPTETPATPEPSTGKPSTGKPGKPTETPVTPEPSTGKPGKPTETPATPEPTTGKPSTGKPGKPTETPVPSSGEGKPTPAPETPKPSGKPTPPEPTGPAPVKPADPTPAPETSKPSGKPTPSEPIGPAPVKPAPPTGEDRPTPAPSTPGGKPTPVEPTPAPETSKPAGKPTPSEPTGPAPVKPAPPSDEDRPTPAPSTPGGKPTPPEPSSPATVKPIGGEPTSAPSDDDSSDDVPPTPTTGSPATGDGKPTPVPSKPTDDDSSDDDDEPTPVPTKVTPPSDGGKPSPTTGAPSSEGTPSPTVKPTKKPKNCHA